MSVSSLTLDVNQRTSVTAIVRDASGTVLSAKTVSWQTSDASVVKGTVSGNSAELLGMGAGSATVTASVDGVTGRIDVQVLSAAPAPVSTVTIAPSSATIAIGEALPMVATVRDANGNALSGRTVNWTTSNSAIVSGTVNGANATVSGVAAGTVTITASSEGRSGTATVTVSSGTGGAISQDVDAVVVLRVRGCNYFLADGPKGLFLLEWFGGYDPVEGDKLIGEVSSFGMKDVYYTNVKQRGRLWVEDYLLSRTRAGEKLADKCD
jgi:uncharacterized protein YjdB